jgi:hypothetical protein
MKGKVLVSIFLGEITEACSLQAEEEYGEILLLLVML